MIIRCKIDKSSFSSPQFFPTMTGGVRGRLLLIALILTLVLEAQTIVIDGEIRPRTEFQDGYSKPISTANDPGVFTTQRTRLNFAYSNALISTMVSLQDARVFGQEANASSTATVSIYEAWGDVVLLPGVSLKIGRQAVKYDDNRLFSSPIWSNTGTSHDMATLKYRINDWQIDVASAYNNRTAIASEAFYTPGSKYRAMNILYLSKSLTNGLLLSAIAIDEGLQDTVGIGTSYKKWDMNHCFTYGGNLKYNHPESPVTALATAYFQSGKNFYGTIMNAKLLAVRAEYMINKAATACIGTDYVSGDANGTADGVQSNFKKLYGADHVFNGVMDYWDTPPATGLLDYFGGVNTKVGKNLTLEGSYHIFNTEYAGKNKKNIAYAKNLGSEFDFTITYNLNNWATMQCGYCKYFLNNNTLIAKDIVTSATMIPDVRSPQWAYLMFCIKPTFLKN